MKRFSTVECILTPRPEFQGRSCLPEVLAAAGERLTLQVFWWQRKTDPYPGEWALGKADGGWILQHVASIHGPFARTAHTAAPAEA